MRHLIVVLVVLVLLTIGLVDVLMPLMADVREAIHASGEARP